MMGHYSLLDTLMIFMGNLKSDGDIKYRFWTNSIFLIKNKISPILFLIRNNISKV